VHRLIGWCALLLVSACDSSTASEAESLPDKAVLVFDLTTGISESQGGGLFPTPFEHTLLGTLQALDAVRRADGPKGFFVKLGGVSPGWAMAEELGREFKLLREGGRPVICHADGISNDSLWFAATACSEIWVSPSGSVDTYGMGAQAVYFAGLLERLNVQAEFLHMGKYKSAAETFTETGPTEPARESMQSLLDSLRESWKAGILEHRSDKRSADAAENGPWLPQEALAIGLIDGVGFESQARQRLADQTGSPVDDVGPANGTERKESPLRALVELVMGNDEVQGRRIAVLPAVGAIAYAGGGALSDEGIVATRFIRQVRELRRDSDVKAVVLRIDSPGGSALGSDLMWHELRRLAEAKPVVASIGEVAASGGYYMACAATKVVAERTSIVGSIGVIGGKFTFGDALAGVGITSHTFTASGLEPNKTRAAYESPFTPWDDAVRARIGRHMEYTYELFVQRVAEGRRMEQAAVEAVAQGRVWTGAQGKSNGLVDELGGLARSVTLAKELAGLDDSVPVVLEGQSDPLEGLLGLSQENDDGQSSRVLLQAVAPWASQLGVRQRRQLASYLPLLTQQESVVAAMSAVTLLP
jgi:protease-4